MLHPSPWSHIYFFFFFFNDTATTEIYTLSLHDALPIFEQADRPPWWSRLDRGAQETHCPRGLRALGAQHCFEHRSEEHTSELQSLRHLVCRLLLEKKKNERRVLLHARWDAHASRIYMRL